MRLALTPGPDSHGESHHAAITGSIRVNPGQRGSYMCVCDDGYLGNGDISCTDKDECALSEDNCASNAEQGFQNLILTLI